MTFREKITETYTLAGSAERYEKVIDRLEENINNTCEKDICHFKSLDVGSLASPRGRSGDFKRYAKSTLYTGNDEVRLRVNALFQNPDARFSGEAELTMSYLEGTNQVDLARVRNSIAISGFGRKE